MRICFLASRDWTHPEAAGGDFFLSNLARSLAGRGHTVTIMASSWHGSPREQHVERVSIIRLHPGLLYPFRLFLQFLRIRRSTDLLVEEMFGGKGIPTFALFYPKSRLVAVWYQCHQRIFDEQYPRIIAQVLGLAERLVARLYKNTPIITLSSKSASELVKMGLPSSQIGIVPSAALMDPPRQEDLPPFEAREDSLVFVGKIRRYKRVDHAILTLRRLLDVRGNCRLVIAGNVGEKDTPYLMTLKALAKNLAVEDFVQFKIYSGAIPPREKIELLKRSKILLQPSPVEGFSMTAIEANSCGTPVVVSDGVPHDSVMADQNGFVYPFGNIDSMSHDCRRLLDEPDTWTRMSECALRMAQRFSWEVTTDSFELMLRKHAMTIHGRIGFDS